MSVDKNHSDQFKRYLKGQMSPSEANAFERAVMDDPFAQEALEGFEKQWKSHQKNQTVTYTNLDPGHYTFRVTGSNNDGIWNDVGTLELQRGGFTLFANASHPAILVDAAEHVAIQQKAQATEHSLLGHAR